MKDNSTKFLLACILLAALAVFSPALCKSLHAQQFKLKEHIAPAILVFVAGTAEGVMDGLQFHYDGNHPFWQPDISWRNKYKGGDPANGKTFAGKYFVAATDGWHLMKLTRNAALFTAFTLKIGEKKKWWVYVAEGACYWVVNRIGFNISYKLF